MCSDSPPSSPRTDRRKSRTRRQLRAALFDLLNTRSYETITVEDITRSADLGRTTFYLHYRDKEDLLLESIEEIALEMKSQVFHAVRQGGRAEEDRDGYALGLRPIGLVLEYLAVNRSLYLPILRGEGMPRAPERIRRIIEEGVLEFFSARRAAFSKSLDPVIPLEVINGFFAASFLGMITWWLERDMPYPPEEMAEMFRQLFLFGARQALLGPVESPTVS